MHCVKKMDSLKLILYILQVAIIKPRCNKSTGTFSLSFSQYEIEK